MSIFGSIMDKVFHAAEAVIGIPAPPAEAPTAPAGAAPAAATTAAAEPAISAPSAPQAGAAPAGPVDVKAVLSAMAEKKGGGGNWRTSIVDLLKLLDLDTSLTARKQLADELDTHIAAAGSAEENIALHKAVMKKLAENGGKVPDSMKA